MQGDGAYSATLPLLSSPTPARCYRHAFRTKVTNNLRCDWRYTTHQAHDRWSELQTRQRYNLEAGALRSGPAADLTLRAAPRGIWILPFFYLPLDQARAVPPPSIEGVEDES
jgi:hypothetical protein